MLIKTQTDKWKDSWFLSLSGQHMLMFMYITENCDEAGIFEINFSVMESHLKMPASIVSCCLKDISKCYIPSKTVDKSGFPTKIWIKKYLLHQEQLPLNTTNSQHKKIYERLKDNLDEFNNNEKMKAIIDEVGVKSDKKIYRAKRVPPSFQAPTLNEFLDFCHEQKQTNDNECTKAYNHYASVGWVKGKNSQLILDWKAHMRNIFMLDDWKLRCTIKSAPDMSKKTKQVIDGHNAIREHFNIKPEEKPAEQKQD